MPLVWNALTNNLDYADVGGDGPSVPYPGGVVTWTEVLSATQDMAPDNGYTANSASLITFTLPAVCAYGKYMRIGGVGAGGWKIAQNANQVIHYGNVDTTTGVTGYLASSNRYDCIELLCVVEDLEFLVIAGPQGSLTYN